MQPTNIVPPLSKLCSSTRTEWTTTEGENDGSNESHRPHRRTFSLHRRHESRTKQRREIGERESWPWWIGVKQNEREINTVIQICGVIIIPATYGVQKTATKSGVSVDLLLAVGNFEKIFRKKLYNISKNNISKIFSDEIYMHVYTENNIFIPKLYIFKIFRK